MKWLTFITPVRQVGDQAGESRLPRAKQIQVFYLSKSHKLLLLSTDSNNAALVNLVMGSAQLLLPRIKSEQDRRNDD
ncbi:hypothetical protein D9M71_606590 [compost metagenome]